MNFEIERKSDCAVVRCSVDLTEATCKELYGILNQLVAEFANLPTHSIILDLMDHAKVDPSIARELTLIDEKLKSIHRNLSLVHIPGISAEEAKAPLPDQPGPEARAGGTAGENLLQVHAELVSALRQALLKTCGTLCPGFVIQPMPPFVQGRRFESESEIAAALDVVGKGVEGSIVLSFPRSIFLALLGEMHGQRYESLTPELADGAAELLNMTRSIARGSSRNYKISKEIPEVGTSTVLERSLRAFSAIIVLPFGALDSQFHLLIGIADR